MVPIMKPFVLMRVKYSRLTMRRSLRTGSPVDKNFIERRLEKFEPDDADIFLDGGLQDFLGVGAGFQFGFHAISQASQANDSGILQESVGAGKLYVQRILAVGLFDGAKLAVEHVVAFVDEAN